MRRGGGGFGNGFLPVCDFILIAATTKAWPAKAGLKNHYLQVRLGCDIFTPARRQIDNAAGIWLNHGVAA
jgi:hypothetical protein